MSQTYQNSLRTFSPAMIKRIPISALKVGMHYRPQRLDPITPSARRGDQAEETIEKIRRMGVQYVYIDVSRGADCQDSEPAAAVDGQWKQCPQGIRSPETGVCPKAPLAEEIVIAQRVHSRARPGGQFMNNVKIGGAIDVAPIHQLADELQEFSAAKCNALSCLGRIREKDNYLLEHSVNLSVLMSLFGGYRLAADILPDHCRCAAA